MHIDTLTIPIVLDTLDTLDTLEQLKTGTKKPTPTRDEPLESVGIAVFGC